MCDGVSAVLAIGLITGAASTGYSYYAQQEEAKAQNKFNEAAAKEGQALAQQSFQFETQKAALQQQEINEANAQQVQGIQKEAAQARATARVAAGESGVSGLSVDSLIADFNRQEGESLSALRTNRLFEQRQAMAELRGLRAQGMERLASTRYRKLGGPSPIGLAIDVGAQSLNTYSTYQQSLK